MWNFKGTLWNSTRNILPIHREMLILFAGVHSRAHGFKSSQAFLKRPPVLLRRLPDAKWMGNTGNTACSQQPATPGAELKVTVGVRSRSNHITIASRWPCLRISRCWWWLMPCWNWLRLCAGKNRKIFHFIDTEWRHRTWSTLVQVVLLACLVSNHHLSHLDLSLMKSSGINFNSKLLGNNIKCKNISMFPKTNSAQGLRTKTYL